MKILQKPILIIIAVFLVLPLYGNYQTEYVVMVIIDGLRYSEGLGHPDRLYVPRMADLATQGAIVDTFLNDGFTYTSRAVPAIWCGAWTDIYTFSDPDCNGSTNNYTELPTIFEYYRKQLAKPETDCVYALKDLCSWKASFHPDYGPDYWPLYHTVGNTDVDVWQETRQIIASQAPHFLLMYLADVDHAGHSGVWDDYLNAITIADSLVGCMWDALQANPLYADKTTLLVTNDHGRHDYDFTGHGDGCEGCRRIQLLAVGPDIEAGLVSDIPRSIPDIAPTIGEIMGFTADSTTGSAMTELFSPSVGISKSPASHQINMVSFPNPFNPVTTIQYELPFRSEVTITVYDILGGVVSTLVSETQEAGFKSVKWNADNVASGVYLYQIKARLRSSSYGGQAGDPSTTLRLSASDRQASSGHSFVQTRKMVLLK